MSAPQQNKFHLPLFTPDQFARLSKDQQYPVLKQQMGLGMSTTYHLVKDQMIGYHVWASQTITNFIEGVIKKSSENNSNQNNQNLVILNQMLNVHNNCLTKLNNILNGNAENINGLNDDHEMESQQEDDHPRQESTVDLDDINTEYSNNDNNMNGLNEDHEIESQQENIVSLHDINTINSNINENDSDRIRMDVNYDRNEINVETPNNSCDFFQGIPNNVDNEVIIIDGEDDTNYIEMIPTNDSVSLYQDMPALSPDPDTLSNKKTNNQQNVKKSQVM